MKYAQQFEEFHREVAVDLPRRSTRRKASRAAMQFAIENRHKYPTPEALRQATLDHLRSGKEAQDDEYGSFILSFLLTPIINWMVGRLIQWVWNRYVGEDESTTPTAPKPARTKGTPKGSRRQSRSKAD